MSSRGGFPPGGRPARPTMPERGSGHGPDPPPVHESDVANPAHDDGWQKAIFFQIERNMYGSGMTKLNQQRSRPRSDQRPTASYSNGGGNFHRTPFQTTCTQGRQNLKNDGRTMGHGCVGEPLWKGDPERRLPMGRFDRPTCMAETPKGDFLPFLARKSPPDDGLWRMCNVFPPRL